MQTDTPGPRLLGQLVPLSVATTSTQILGPNARRIGLLISSASGANLTVNFGAPAVLSQGVNIPSNTQALRLTYAEVGELIRQPVFAAASIGAALCSILEVSLP